MNRTIIQAALITIGLSLAAVPVFAHEERCDRAWSGYEGMDLSSRIDSRLTRLHDSLKLNASQETAWNDFSGKMKPVNTEKADRPDWRSMNTPARMDRMLELIKSRETRMADRAVAVKTFYAALTPDQQQIFDRQFMRADFRHHRPVMNDPSKPDVKSN